MNQCEELLKLLMEAVQQEGQKKEEPCANGGIPVGVSNRHVHLSQADLDRLFGPGYELTKMKDLSQPGQYACKEMVTRNFFFFAVNLIILETVPYQVANLEIVPDTLLIRMIVQNENTF